jgi:hypothetical protein
LVDKTSRVSHLRFAFDHLLVLTQLAPFLSGTSLVLRSLFWPALDLVIFRELH